MKKKLGLYVTLGAIALVAMAIIIMYLMPVSYLPSMSKPTNITVYQTTSKYGTFSADTSAKTYNEILDAYNKSFQQNFLSAVFAGQTAATSANGELKTTTTKPSYSTYIVLNFDAQKIVVNGHKQNVSVDQVLLQVENTTTFGDVKVYFKQAGTSGTTTYYYMTTLAKQAALYEVITSLTIPE
ncbi:MAG: hypothetical protein IKK20_02845 [Clostridia bacterium]|nr:hypothetical protein [Clostridia bacterium]MBR2221062.1 hypothetical protein [Clostridia bacterium]MBR2433032.1 hypothetical protein [Clostridia bacterium]MBR3790723.1 hypothetical protein [Clostridia bacterium]